MKENGVFQNALQEPVQEPVSQSWRDKLRSQFPKVHIPNSEKAARQDYRKLAYQPRDPKDWTITDPRFEMYSVKDWNSLERRIVGWQEAFREENS